MGKILGAVGVAFAATALVVSIPAGLDALSGLVNPPKRIEPLGESEYSPERLAECRSAAKQNPKTAGLCEPDWPGGMPWSEYQRRQKLVGNNPNTQP